MSTTRPKCNLVGADGNVFAIIGTVSRTLKSSGQANKAKEFRSKATACRSYDDVLQLLQDYVEVY